MLAKSTFIRIMYKSVNEREAILEIVRTCFERWRI